MEDARKAGILQTSPLRVWKFKCAWKRGCAFAVCAFLLAAAALNGQSTPAANPSGVPQGAPAQNAPLPSGETPVFAKPPLAVVPLDKSIPGAALAVDGPMQAWNGRAYLTGSGSITAGTATADVTLPSRGTLRVCASSTVGLTADTRAPAGEVPGLLISLNRGAVEMSFAPSQARAKNADTLLTPYFRILVGGPDAVVVKVRMGERGDTCIDNSGAEASYVLVSSTFQNGVYRVQPGQRAMFEQGSLQSVVDQERESCGCPPPPNGTSSNEFPLAQSEGLAPGSQVPVVSASPDGVDTTGALSYNGASEAEQAAATDTNGPAAQGAKKAHGHRAHKHGKLQDLFDQVGHFFRWLFGAE